MVNRGTVGFSSDRNGQLSNFANQFGKYAPQFAEGVQLAQALADPSSGYGSKLSFAGHSLGGGLAIAEAIATGGKAYVYDTEDINLKTLRNLGFGNNQITQQQFDKSYRNNLYALNTNGDTLTFIQSYLGKLYLQKTVNGAVGDYF